MTKSALKPAATNSGLSKPSQAVSATFAKALSKTTAKVKTKAAAGSTPKIAQKTVRKPVAKAVTKTAVVKPATKPAVAIAVEKPVVTGGAETVVLGPEMRKKELIDRVVSRSGIKKKDAKPVVEAMLAELGEALAESRELILPPFGKLKVRREKKLPNGLAMVVKIRQNNRVPSVFAKTDDVGKLSDS